MAVKNKDFLVRPTSAYDIEIVKSAGNYVFSADGKKYIDFVMGWCVGNIGWGNTEIKKKIKSFNGPDYVNPHFIYEPWNELAELIVSMMPKKLTKCFRVTGGSESVELALEAANAYTKRHKFVSIEGAYHGDTVGALSVGTSEFKFFHPDLLFRTQKINPPLDEAAAKKLEKILAGKEIAAVIMEPIVCNMGIEIPTQNFMKRVQALCKKYGTLFIIDEVATGFGRTGKLFGYQQYKIEPDIICLGKAISGGYGGLGATVTTPKIAKSLAHGGYWSTYGWHPLSVAAAIANIQFIKKHEKKILKNVADMSAYFKSRLSEMKFKYKPTFRIQGLAIGVELQHGDYAAKIVKCARDRGLIVSKDLSTLVLFPALTIDKTTAKQGLDILEKCV